MSIRGWVALGLGVQLIVACNVRDAAPDALRGEQISGKPAPQVDGPRIVERQVPKEAPFVGEAGLAPDGYPWRQPDKVALLNLLRLQRFDDLDRFFAFYQDAFEKDYRHETWPDEAVSAFFVADPALEPLLNAWVAHAPQSFAAYVSRGNYRYKLGWHYRGNKYAAETTVWQFRSMEEYFAAASVDLRKSIELRPRLVAGYRRLLLIGNVGSVPVAEEKLLLKQALELCPLCYSVHATHLGDITPRWGGSYEAMAAYVEETRPLWARNPRLQRLTGHVDLDRCSVAELDDNLEIAHVYCDQALRVGGDPAVLCGKADVLIEQDRHAEALPFLDRALRAEPHNRDALESRLDARIGAKDFIGAAEDALNARHLDPTDKHVAKQVKWLIERLRYDGDQLRKAEKGAEAAKVFSLALALAPDDRDLLMRMGHSVKTTELGADAIATQLAAAPDDFDLRLRIDSGLAASNRFADVVRMWDAFIVTHASDPRPFAERGGAKWHLRQLTEAVADMQHACDLGMSKACGDVAQMKARAGL